MIFFLIAAAIAFAAGAVSCATFTWFCPPAYRIARNAAMRVMTLGRRL